MGGGEWCVIIGSYVIHQKLSNVEPERCWRALPEPAMRSALLLLVVVLVTTAAATETCENGLDGQVDSLLSADVTEAERLAAIASAVRVMNSRIKKILLFILP